MSQRTAPQTEGPSPVHAQPLRATRVQGEQVQFSVASPPRGPSGGHRCGRSRKAALCLPSLPRGHWDMASLEGRGPVGETQSCCMEGHGPLGQTWSSDKDALWPAWRTHRRTPLGQPEDGTGASRRHRCPHSLQGRSRQLPPRSPAALAWSAMRLKSDVLLSVTSIDMDDIKLFSGGRGASR